MDERAVAVANLPKQDLLVALRVFLAQQPQVCARIYEQLLAANPSTDPRPAFSPDKVGMYVSKAQVEHVGPREVTVGLTFRGVSNHSVRIPFSGAALGALTKAIARTSEVEARQVDVSIHDLFDAETK